jgi:hypothetical protein
MKPISVVPIPNSLAMTGATVDVGPVEIGDEIHQADEEEDCPTGGSGTLRGNWHLGSFRLGPAIITGVWRFFAPCSIGSSRDYSALDEWTR